MGRQEEIYVLNVRNNRTRPISEKPNPESNAGLGHGVIYKKLEDTGVALDEGSSRDHHLD
jgi:hypothetical protein